MSTSQLDICNVALETIGCAPITSIDATVKGAITLKRAWPIIVDAILHENIWSFSLAWDALTLLGESGEALGPKAIYAYAYSKPAGFIRGVRMVDPLDSWEEVGEEIHTDTQGAIFQYVKRQSDVNLFPPLFVLALTYRLAAQICVPMNQDKAKARENMEIYRYYVDLAKVANALTSVNAKDETTDNLFVAARE